MMGPSMKVPMDPKPLTKPITAEAALRPSISPSSAGNDPQRMISGPQLRIPTTIMTKEFIKRPDPEVATNTIKANALRSVSTVDPRRARSLKNLQRRPDLKQLTFSNLTVLKYLLFKRVADGGRADDASEFKHGGKHASIRLGILELQ